MHLKMNLIFQVFGDLEKLGLVLSYDSHNDIILSDSVCTLLALEGDLDHVHKCWNSFVRSRRFKGFTDKSFGYARTVLKAICFIILIK